MSKRRQHGEIVLKRVNAGFVGQASLVKIAGPEWGEPEPWCLLCDDPECREWPNLEECDEAGNPLGGLAYHVSECQMDDPSTLKLAR